LLLQFNDRSEIRLISSFSRMTTRGTSNKPALFWHYSSWQREVLIDVSGPPRGFAARR